MNRRDAEVRRERRAGTSGTSGSASLRSLRLCVETAVSREGEAGHDHQHHGGQHVISAQARVEAADCVYFAWFFSARLWPCTASSALSWPSRTSFQARQ